MHVMGASDGTTFSSFLAIWLSLVEPYTRMNKKRASVLCLLWTRPIYTSKPFGWVVLMPFFTWACSPFITYLVLQNGHQWHTLPWVFIPYGLLLLVDIHCSLGFDRYLWWIFGQWVVIFKIIAWALIISYCFINNIYYFEMMNSIP